MAKEKSLVEEAIIQMKNLEEAVAENAKGILASTMSQEIKELVKESLSEQESDVEVEDDTEIDMDMDMDVDNQDTDVEDDDMEDDMEDMDMSDDLMGGDDMDDMDMEEPIDLTDKSDEEVLRVFQLMGPEDNIVVTKDAGGNINLKDTQANKEYMIVGEGMEDEMLEDDMEDMEEDEFYESKSNIDDIVAKVFDEDDSQDMMEDENMDFNSEEFDEEDEMEEESEIVYEITFDDEDEEEVEMEEEEEHMFESKSIKKSIKPKGVGMGKGPNVKVYSNKPNQGTGFKTKMKEAPKSVGTGKAKFEYKEGENLGDKLGTNKMVKKAETKEGVRTLGAGSRAGRKGGLPKPRAGSAFNMALKENDSRELQVLREKNEEYRKALNIFRNKLNEVAVFNSNLAYATRLFTEHSTSKQEKINILRRFDGVESIKESKGLYKTIKDELSPTTSQPMNESFERKIENTPATGSAVNLIENKTYENPQFLRMKDLMSKMNK
jgi:hypothetical protein